MKQNTQNIHNNTYLLTPWCRVLLEKLTGLQLVKKFPAFHGARRFVTALTSVRHLSLSWASPIQFIYPHSTSWRSILILSTHLRLGLPVGLFPSGFPSKTLYNPLSSPIRATCPAHLIFLDFITPTILGEEYKLFNSSLCSLLHSPVTSSLLVSIILLNTMFSNTNVHYCLHKCPPPVPIQNISPGPRLTVWMFRNKIHLYGEKLPPRPTPKLGDHPLSAVRDCLFTIFAATLHIGCRTSLRTRHSVVTGR